VQLSSTRVREARVREARALRPYTGCRPSTGSSTHFHRNISARPTGLSQKHFSGGHGGGLSQKRWSPLRRTAAEYIRCAPCLVSLTEPECAERAAARRRCVREVDLRGHTCVPCVSSVRTYTLDRGSNRDPSARAVSPHRPRRSTHDPRPTSTTTLHRGFHTSDLKRRLVKSLQVSYP
jgi:hypothetical protein